MTPIPLPPTQTTSSFEPPACVTFPTRPTAPGGTSTDLVAHRLPARPREGLYTGGLKAGEDGRPPVATCPGAWGASVRAGCVLTVPWPISHPSSTLALMLPAAPRIGMQCEAPASKALQDLELCLLCKEGALGHCGDPQQDRRPLGVGR